MCIRDRVVTTPTNVDTPVTLIFPPILALFSIPTPPSTTRAPLSFVDESVTSAITTDTPLLYVQSAPVTCILSVPFSSYSIFASLLSPKVRNVSSGIITSPEPLGDMNKSPSVFVVESTFASNLKLSTFHYLPFYFDQR